MSGTELDKQVIEIMKKGDCYFTGGPSVLPFLKKAIEENGLDGKIIEVPSLYDFKPEKGKKHYIVPKVQTPEVPSLYYPHIMMHNGAILGIVQPVMK